MTGQLTLPSHSLDVGRIVLFKSVEFQAGGRVVSCCGLAINLLTYSTLFLILGGLFFFGLGGIFGV
jgi:hypothetical protein